jgi:hypothetical protein
LFFGEGAHLGAADFFDGLEQKLNDVEGNFSISPGAVGMSLV